MASPDPVATIAVVASPFGPIHVAVGDRAVVGLELRTTTVAFADGLGRRLGGPIAGSADGTVEPVERAPSGQVGMLRRAIAALEAYLGGDPDALDLPVALVGLSAWDRRVLSGVREIPFGAVTSYGRLARRVGALGAARAVGGAVSRNPVGLFVPCHRIIAGDGTLGGYGGGPWGDREENLALKGELLAHECVTIPARTLVP